MAAVNPVELQRYLNLIPAIQLAPDQHIWLYYDVEADTLYVNFKRPSQATDSELTADDVIIRYEDSAIIGFTVLHASHRQ